MRDHPDELKRRLEATPLSRRVFVESIEHLAKGPTDDVIDDAWHTTIVIGQSLMHATNATKSDWARAFTGNTMRRDVVMKANMIERIAERIKNIQLENRCAVELLEALADKQQAIIYCDPPYRSSKWKNTSYNEGVDFDALADALQSQTGRVCISGYSDEWDHLGWHKLSVKSKFQSFQTDTNTGSRDRIESVWLNYESDNKQTTLNLGL